MKDSNDQRPRHDFLHYVPMLLAKGPNQGFDGVYKWH